MRCIICIPDTALYMHIKHQAPHAYTCKHACIEQTAHFHCERQQNFSASECEVSVRACASVFETSVQAQPEVQIRTSSLAVKLCSRSEALLTVKLCCRSVAASTLAPSTRSFECARSKVWRAREASTALEASLRPVSKSSTHSSGSKLQYTYSSKQVDGPS